MTRNNSDFNLHSFIKNAEADYPYYAGQMNSEPSLEHFIHGNPTTMGGHRYPKEYIKDVMNMNDATAEDHYNTVQHVLRSSGISDTVTVRRTGEPKKGVTNVSLIPGWKSWKAFQETPPAKTYEWQVSKSDIVAIGNPHEGEVFVKHPKDRQVKEVD
jgi:hypothetical protein